MFNIMVATEYAVPPPIRHADIPAVAQVMPHKELRRDRDRKKNDQKKKRAALAAFCAFWPPRSVSVPGVCS